MSRVVAIDNLSVEIGGREILRGISLEINEGELVCVAGSIGSGKSTFLKVLTGIIPELYKGFRVYGNISIFGLKPVEVLHKGLVAYVPQDVYSFFIGSTPREELAILGIDSSCCSDIDLDKDINCLSGGQLYRFLLYSALFSGARFIAIDEPSSHIDWWSIEEVFRGIERFVNDEKTIVVVADHKLDTLEKFCSKIIDLDDSRRSYCSFPSITTLQRSKVIVEIENIWVSYSGKSILRDISLSINLGEAIAIVGRNGSGKTTLLKVLSKIIKPSRGRVSIDRGTRIFLVPQNPIYWFPNGSVKNVLESLAKRYRSRESINNVLEMFNLIDKQDRDVYSLSIGETRMLSLALAYISKANLIIIDEPTLGMDCRSMKTFMNTINILLENGSSIVIATHDLDFARLFDSVYLLEEGRLIDIESHDKDG
ncbi:MAG: ATP-binding cassette domain-containing protein [Ignisphaera sp.]